MSPHRRVSAQRPPSANGRASRAYRGRRGPPQRRARQKHSGLTKACSFLSLFLTSAQRSKLAPIFSSLVHFHSEMAVSLSPFGPWIQPLSGDAVAAATPTSACASLPANARDVDNPADQNLTLFHLPLVRSHRERLDLLLQALTSPWLYWAQRRAGQAGLNCDDPYHDSRGQDRGHCRTRPSVSAAVARRGPAVFWFWRCRCKAWPSITTRTWLRGNLGESKIRRGRETRERVDLWVWVWVWVRDGPSSDLFLETTTSQVPRKDPIHLHHDCILSECFLMAAEC